VQSVKNKELIATVQHLIKILDHRPISMPHVLPTGTYIIYFLEICSGYDYGWNSAHKTLKNNNQSVNHW